MDHAQAELKKQAETAIEEWYESKETTDRALADSLARDRYPSEERRGHRRNRPGNGGARPMSVLDRPMSNPTEPTRDERREAVLGWRLDLYERLFIAAISSGAGPHGADGVARRGLDTIIAAEVDISEAAHKKREESTP